MFEELLVEDSQRAAENRARIAKEKETANQRWEEMNKVKYKVTPEQCKRKRIK